MRYYLETNALRSLGSYLIRNPVALKDAFTSTFSLFELIKKIGRGEDSERRVAVLKALWESDISVRQSMPADLIREAYGWESEKLDSTEVNNALIRILDGWENTTSAPQELTDDEQYREIIAIHETGTLRFQEMLSKLHTGPAPEPERLLHDSETMFEPNVEPHKQFEPSDTRHPAYFFMDWIRDAQAIKTYRTLDLPDSETVSDIEILRRYDRQLDRFFFATHIFEMRKSANRERSGKNDMLDLLHTLYLHDNDTVMVSNDRIFEFVLPNRNRISVEAFKALHLEPVPVAAIDASNASTVQEAV